MNAGSLLARTAVLPGGQPPGEDRVRVGANAVVVLDGASGTDTTVSVSDYVDHLADALVEALDQDPGLPLRHALADALRSTVGALRVMPGESPSSTVSIIRRRGELLDLLVLGDSPIYVGAGGVRFTDDRLAELHFPSRSKIYARLADGTGYDEVHRDLLARLSGEKAPYLNEPDGYWIAEARPEAGAHARIRTVPATVPWCVLLTDGTDGPMRHLGMRPADLVERSDQELDDVLRSLHSWEQEQDPDARELPRFKVHDDKTAAVVTPA